MIPQNQQRYQEFRQIVASLQQRKQQLERDIEITRQQIGSMEAELKNVDAMILSHQHGAEIIKVLTENSIAIVEYTGDQPMTLNEFPVTTQLAQQAGIPVPQPVQPQAQQVQPQAVQQEPVQPQQTYQNPPAQAYAPQPPITPQAQQTFAPPSYPSPQDMAAAQAVQGPQIVQGNPPVTTE